MREILFRAKREDTEEWVSGGSIIKFLDNFERSFYMPDFKAKCICVHDAETDNIERFEEGVFYKIYSHTLCQHTGLEDRNGNGIWENDVCRVFSSSISEEDGNFVVEWDKDGSRFILSGYGLVVDFDNIYGHECEVIGNVFDNPELLEEP